MNTNKYEQFSLEELEILTNDYILRHWSNGGRSEFDMSINDISLARIKKYHERQGKCFLGRINQWESLKEGEKALLVEFTGQHVFNCEYDIVVPDKDERLEDLLTEHNTPHETFDSQATFSRCKAITSRTHEIGGIHLFWT